MERRDFFKLGLTGVGVAAASGLSPGALGVSSPDVSQNSGLNRPLKHKILI